MKNECKVVEEKEEYFIEPRIVKNVKATFVDDGRSMTFHRRKRSRRQQVVVTAGDVPIEPF